MASPKTLELRRKAQDSKVLSERLQKINEAAKRRTCGPCSACCYVLSIEGVPEVEGKKPALHACPDQGADAYCERQYVGQCSIYEDGRPEVCKGFRCSWRQGGFGEFDRPDRIGIMLEHRTLKIGAHVVAWEVWPDASVHGFGLELLRTLSPATVVIVMRHDGTRDVLGKESEVKAVLAAAGMKMSLSDDGKTVTAKPEAPEAAQEVEGNG